MDSNNYISRDGRLSLRLTDGWVEYDDGDDTTHAFWHETETPWTGNFRVTTFQWPNTTDSKMDKAVEYITSEIADNAGAQRLRLGQYDCAHYKKESQQEGGEVIYYWIAGTHNDLFICTFTIDKAQEAMPINVRELTSVGNMIASIKII